MVISFGTIFRQLGRSIKTFTTFLWRWSYLWTYCILIAHKSFNIFVIKSDKYTLILLVGGKQFVVIINLEWSTKFFQIRLSPNILLEVHSIIGNSIFLFTSLFYMQIIWRRLPLIIDTKCLCTLFMLRHNKTEWKEQSMPNLNKRVLPSVVKKTVTRQCLEDLTYTHAYKPILEYKTD